MCQTGVLLTIANATEITKRNECYALSLCFFVVQVIMANYAKGGANPINNRKSYVMNSSLISYFVSCFFHYSFSAFYVYPNSNLVRSRGRYGQRGNIFTVQESKVRFCYLLSYMTSLTLA